MYYSIVVCMNCSCTIKPSRKQTRNSYKNVLLLICTLSMSFNRNESAFDAPIGRHQINQPIRTPDVLSKRETNSY
uniref:SFRICE_001911 n=1 Tax=Spodoptera frugiperda TaxID=7108 RepID=A0A2H1WW72_SPOFR